MPTGKMTETASQTQSLKHVSIFTDGAAVPNPGAGGYGVVLRFGEHVKELSGGFRCTTNNRMELMGVIVGLEALKERCNVTLHSDSQYIVNSITSGAVFRWQRNHWTLNPGGTKQPKNIDLWERLLAAYEKHDVEMVWVKGHTGIADNERCDALAMAACMRSDLPLDPGYVESTAEVVQGNTTVNQRPSKGQGKITVEGQACRKCGTPVVKRTPRRRKLKEGQMYYYSWYLHCSSCGTMYMVEEAKRPIGDDDR